MCVCMCVCVTVYFSCNCSTVATKLIFGSIICSHKVFYSTYKSTKSLAFVSYKSQKRAVKAASLYIVLIIIAIFCELDLFTDTPLIPVYVMRMHAYPHV